MKYIGEVKTNWRYLTAAATGMGCGYMLNYYITGLFIPELLAEFGWSKAQFALLGAGVILTIFTLPIAGRLTDLFGVRRMAMVGVISSPMIFSAYATMEGSFNYFLFLNILHLVIIGATTTGVVYSRLIAESFGTARGLALAIAASTPVAVAALLSPILSMVIEQYGWRAGYFTVAAGTGALGVLALFLIPSDSGRRAHSGARPLAQDYAAIFRNPTFRLAALGLFLCNLTLLVQAPQLKLILLDHNMSSATASLMMSLYAAGVIAGRLLCGLALDRFPTHIVAAIGFGLPAIGLFILGSDAENTLLLGAGVLVVGVALGAELDITAYMIMRYFKVEVFSTVYSLLGAVINVSAALGSLLLSLTLKVTAEFGLFLFASGGATLVGGALLAMLGRTAPALEPEPEPEPEPHERHPAAPAAVSQT